MAEIARSVVAAVPPTVRDAGAPAPPRRPARRPFALVLAGGVIVLFVGAGALALWVGRSSPVPAPAPAANLGKVLTGGFSLHNVNGGAAVKAPWLDHRPAVVFFFSSWCAPCHAAAHRLAALSAHGIGGVVFVGVDGDTTAASAQRFVANTGVRFPVGVDPLLTLTARLVPGPAPAAMFVRSSGRVVDVTYGALTDQQLSAGLSKLR